MILKKNIKISNISICFNWKILKSYISSWIIPKSVIFPFWYLYFQLKYNEISYISKWLPHLKKKMSKSDIFQFNFYIFYWKITKSIIFLLDFKICNWNISKASQFLIDAYIFNRKMPKSPIFEFDFYIFIWKITKSIIFPFHFQIFNWKTSIWCLHFTLINMMSTFLIEQ